MNSGLSVPSSCLCIEFFIGLVQISLSGFSLRFDGRDFVVTISKEFSVSLIPAIGEVDGVLVLVLHGLIGSLFHTPVLLHLCELTIDLGKDSSHHVEDFYKSLLVGEILHHS